MIKYLILIMLTFVTHNSAQDHSADIRGLISKINIGLQNSNLPDESTLNLIDSSISLIESNFRGKIDISEFKEEYLGFKEFSKLNPRIDTLKKVFRSVNNKFNSLFGTVFFNAILNSSKQKIIVFSTSMSCECTLDMCYEQEVVVQNLLEDKNLNTDYVVIDCFSNTELQAEYQVGFIPTVLILDSANKEVKSFVRDENLLVNLSEIIK
ncbi:MAG: hypothetical protein Q8N03_12400 [Ignavibacteria bacterium]|nr:hypothetical protein [Ignavibacteria bacterium]